MSKLSAISFMPMINRLACCKENIRSLSLYTSVY